MIRVEIKILFIEENKLFTFMCKSDNNLAAFNMGAVISMLRLTYSHEDEVGDINDSIDRSHAAVGDQSLHPCR